jgi:hypothetical protein
MAMAAAVARHEHHVEAIEHAEQELVGGLAERRGDAAPRGVLQARNLINTAAAENSQHRHQLLPVALWCIMTRLIIPPPSYGGG